MILKFMQEILSMSEHDIITYSSTAPHRYKVYTIAKRNSNKRRVIAHPASELKFIQRALISAFGDRLSPSDCAYAYVRNRNIKDNAVKHANSTYLLKMDFYDFFPSITPDLFFKKLSQHQIELTELDAKILTGIIFWKPRRDRGLVLSIGAPTSPLISNFIMKDFDETINKICAEREITYTRYADDLTFSTKYKDILFKIPQLVKDYLYNSDYKEIKVNDKKTVFSSKAHNRHVTGITLTNNNNISLGAKKKRMISAMIHHFKIGRLDEDRIPTLQGYLAFAEHIEPRFRDRMIVKYGIECMTTIYEYKKN